MTTAPKLKMKMPPLQTHQTNSTVDYHFRLDYPRESQLPELFSRLTSGCEDGYGTRHTFPKGIEEAVVVAVYGGWSHADIASRSYALCRYVR